MDCRRCNLGRVKREICLSKIYLLDRRTNSPTHINAQSECMKTPFILFLTANFCFVLIFSLSSCCCGFVFMSALFAANETFPLPFILLDSRWLIVSLSCAKRCFSCKHPENLFFFVKCKWFIGAAYRSDQKNQWTKFSSQENEWGGGVKAKWTKFFYL